MTKLEGCRVEIGQQPRKEKVSPAFDLVIRRPIAAPGLGTAFTTLLQGRIPSDPARCFFPCLREEPAADPIPDRFNLTLMRVQWLTHSGQLKIC
jgi:hypothetical protein